MKRMLKNKWLSVGVCLFLALIISSCTITVESVEYFNVTIQNTTMTHMVVSFTEGYLDRVINASDQQTFSLRKGTIISAITNTNPATHFVFNSDPTQFNFELDGVGYTLVAEWNIAVGYNIRVTRVL